MTVAALALDRNLQANPFGGAAHYCYHACDPIAPNGAVFASRHGRTSVLDSTTDLLKRAREGEGTAMNRLFERLAPPLHRWARGRLPGWARGTVSTVDLVQEALLATFTAIENGHAIGDEAIHAYVRQALKSRLIDELRRVNRRPATEAMARSMPDEQQSPLDSAVSVEAMERYQRGLDSLLPAERNAVIARIELDLPYADIAALLEKPSEDAARMAVGRALRKLAEAMGRG